MFSFRSRAPAWRMAVAAVIVAVLAVPAAGNPVTAGVPITSLLTLEAAEAHALRQQPQLQSLEAQVSAARERAVSAGQLPDPQLRAGVSNLPVNGEDRFSLADDFMTMTSVGVMQEFPRAEKRRLRSEAERLLARAGEAELVVQTRAIRRAIAQAYLVLWQAERATALVDAMIAEARRERDAVDIAFRAGRASQADVLAAVVELELLQDRRARQLQEAAEAREQLMRWMGAPVAGAIPAEPPSLPAPPELAALLAAIEHHPELQMAEVDIAARRNTWALARAAYTPDWRIELMYGVRPEFDDMATLQVGIDLPVFRGQRQDRDVAAALKETEAVLSMHEDHARRLRAEASAAWRAWSLAQERLARYDSVIVPTASARAEAALAAYRAGRAELAAVLNARRAALDVNLMRLELQVEILQRLAELRYLSP